MITGFAKTPHPSAPQTPSPQGEGYPSGYLLSLIRHGVAVPPSPGGRLNLDPLPEEDSPARGNVVEDDKRVV